jgi:hypothetical protein
LLEEVRKFHAASLRGDYYDGFDVNSRNFMAKSEGTEVFIAEFAQFLGKCIRAVEKGQNVVGSRIVDVWPSAVQPRPTPHVD